MVLAQPVRRGATTLLPAERELTAGDIQALQRRFPEAFVYLQLPSLDDQVVFDSEEIDHERSVQVLEECRRLAEMAYRSAKDPKDAGGNVVAEAERFLRRYMDEPLKAALPQIHKEGADYLVEHAAMTLFYSMLIAEQASTHIHRERRRQTAAMKLSSAVTESLLPLVMACLYADMSMTGRVSNEGPISKADWEKVFKHPDASAELLPEAAGSVARLAVRSHHENYNGSGYPMHLAGERLHVLARVIRVADSFDAGLTERRFRPAKPPVQVLWEMARGPASGSYDPALVEGLLSAVRPFPVGTRLQMDEVGYAVVVGNGKDAFRPRAVLLKPTEGMTGCDAFDTAMPRVPRIQSVGDHDLSYLYQRPAA